MGLNQTLFSTANIVRLGTWSFFPARRLSVSWFVYLCVCFFILFFFVCFLVVRFLFVRVFVFPFFIFVGLIAFAGKGFP